MNLKIKKIIGSSVDIYGTDFLLDNNNIAILSLYLAYAVNTPVPLPLHFQTFTGPALVEWEEDGNFILAVNGNHLNVCITKEEAVILSSEIAKQSHDQFSTVPILTDTTAWEQVDLETFVHKTKSGIIALVYQDEHEKSDLPVGLYVDEVNELCQGVHAKTVCDGNELLCEYIFDESCKTNLVQ